MRVNTETRTNAFNLINISNPIFDSSEEKKNHKQNAQLFSHLFFKYIFIVVQS